MKNILGLRGFTIVWAVVCVIAFVSCGHADVSPTQVNIGIDVGDGGLISNEPCGPPCFLGISPGRTTKDEVITFLGEKIGSQNCDVWDRRMDGGTQGAVCDPPYLAFSFSDSNIVEMLSFKPGINISAQDVFAKYGEPDHVSIGPHEDDAGNVLTVSMVILYDGINLSIGFVDQEGSTYNLAESTLVNIVSYSTIEEYQSYVQRHSVDSWEGYGMYEINDY